MLLALMLGAALAQARVPEAPSSDLRLEVQRPHCDIADALAPSATQFPSDVGEDTLHSYTWRNNAFSSAILDPMIAGRQFPGVMPGRLSRHTRECDLSRNKPSPAPSFSNKSR